MIWSGNRAFVETEGTDQVMMTLPASAASEVWEGPFGGKVIKALSTPKAVEFIKVGPSRWRVTIPQNILFGHKTVLLRVNCIGNIGQAFINGEMISDNFCNGQPWDIRLDCYREQLADYPLTVYIVPIKEGASVSVDSTMAARMEHVRGLTASLDSAVLCFVDETEITLD